MSAAADGNLRPATLLLEWSEADAVVEDASGLQAYDVRGEGALIDALEQTAVFAWAGQHVQRHAAQLCSLLTRAKLRSPTAERLVLDRGELHVVDLPFEHPMTSGTLTVCGRLLAQHEFDVARGSWAAGAPTCSLCATQPTSECLEQAESQLLDSSLHEATVVAVWKAWSEGPFRQQQERRALPWHNGRVVAERVDLLLGPLAQALAKLTVPTGMALDHLRRVVGAEALDDILARAAADKETTDWMLGSLNPLRVRPARMAEVYNLALEAAQQGHTLRLGDVERVLLELPF